ncbi:MAG: hypothetical protein OCD76_00375 [Reichenbachiella sp.]
MKTLIYTVTTILLLCNCGGGVIKERAYQINNETKRSITLSFYKYTSTENDLLIETHTGYTQGSILYKNRVDDSEHHSLLADESLPDGTNYAIVTFDSTKVSYFRSDSSTIIRNIFNDDDYDEFSDDLYIFNFTEEDYNQAKDLVQE